MIVHVPVIGTDQLWFGMPSCVNSMDGRRLEKTGDRFLSFRRATLPVVVPQPAPNLSKADLVGISVLDDEPFEPVRVLIKNAEAYRATVVLNVKAEPSEAGLLKELGDDRRSIVEGVCERLWIRHVGVTETRIIGRNDMKAAR